MAWPIHVARNAPAMPSTVVRMKPAGLFGPGESIRAMMPATKPTTMIQIMPLMAIPLRCVDDEAERRGPRAALDAFSLRKRDGAASNPARQFILVRQPSVRCQMIDDVGQVLAEALQQLVAGQA